MKITSLRAQVNNPERVSVFVDNKYAFSLSYNEVITFKVKNNDELSAADVAKFKKISADGKLRSRTYEWLLNRPRSSRELRNYLYRKKVEPEMIESLTEQFAAKGYLDEHKFATWLVELLKRRGKSNRAIRAELIKKGISREVINEFLDAQDDEVQRLRQIIAKKHSLSRYKNDSTKLARYLMSQGFSWQLVKQELDDFNKP